MFEYIYTQIKLDRSKLIFPPNAHIQHSYYFSLVNGDPDLVEIKDARNIDTCNISEFNLFKFIGRVSNNMFQIIDIAYTREMMEKHGIFMCISPDSFKLELKRAFLKCHERAET